MSTYLANKLIITQPPTIVFLLAFFINIQIKVEAIVAQKKGVSPRLPRPKSIAKINTIPASQE